MDKINDFYEFRLMCLNTDVQTREALGLPPRPRTPEPAPKQVIIRKVVQPTIKIPVVKLVDINEKLDLTNKGGFTRNKRGVSFVEDPPFIEEKRGGRRDLKRVLEDPIDILEDRKKARTVESPPPQPPSKKYKINCAICVTEYFEYQSDLMDHLISQHTVTISKYGCASCRETFNTQSLAKDHDQTHTKSKLPYTCYKCNLTFPRPLPFNKHLSSNKCQGSVQLAVTQEDIKCFQCKKKFITQSLFEWHACFLKSKTKCPKCGKYFQKKPALFKHYVLCEQQGYDASTSMKPTETASKKIKAEKGERSVIDSISSMLSTVEQEISKLKKDSNKKKKKKDKNKEKLVENNVVKSEIMLEEIRDENMDHDDEDLYHDDGGFQNYSDESRPDTPSNEALEPQVQLQENETEKQQTVPPIRIKQERFDSAYGDRTTTVSTVTSTAHSENENSLSNSVNEEQDEEMPAETSGFGADPEVIRNIKKEKDPEARTAAIQKFNKKQQFALKMRIKAEKGVKNAQMSVLNPLAVSAKKTAPSNKLLKIPRELAIRIKREKLDAGYGDQLGNGSERDEAEAESDEEDYYEPEALPIKQERMDPGYGDQASIIRINPLALMREKNQEQHQEIQVPVIAGVSSIAMNEALMAEHENDDNEEENEEEADEEETPENPPAQKSFRHVPIKKEFHIESIRTINHDEQEVEEDEQEEDYYDDYNDTGRGEELQDGGMVQIPSEFHDNSNSPEPDENTKESNEKDQQNSHEEESHTNGAPMENQQHTFDSPRYQEDSQDTEENLNLETSPENQLNVGQSPKYQESPDEISPEEEERLLAETESETQKPDDSESVQQSKSCTYNNESQPIENIINTCLDDLQNELSRQPDQIDEELDDFFNEMGSAGDV